MSLDPISLALMKKQMPCYDTRKTAPLTIEWDGIEKEGQETFEIPNLFLRCAKLSNTVPTIEEVRAGYTVIEGGEEAGTHPNAEYTSEESFGFSCGFFIFIPQTYSLGEYIIPAGTWGVIGDFATEMDITKITLQLPSVTTGELKTIDPKYLPAPLDLYWDSVGTWLYANAECTEKAKVTDYQSAVASGRQIRVLHKYDSGEFLHITPIYHMVQDGQVVFILPQMGEGDDGNGGVEMRFVFAIIDG